MFSYKIADKEYSVPLIGTWSWGGGFNGSRLIFGQSFTEDSLKDTFNKAYNAGFVCWNCAGRSRLSFSVICCSNRELCQGIMIIINPETNKI